MLQTLRAALIILLSFLGMVAAASGFFAVIAFVAE
jgi:hypothetical protein